MMCFDNILWISKSPEYEQIKASKYPIVMDGKEYYSLQDYIIRYRVISVLTNWRDLVPAVLTGIIGAFISIIPSI